MENHSEEDRSHAEYMRLMSDASLDIAIGGLQLVMREYNREFNDFMIEKARRYADRLGNGR